MTQIDPASLTPSLLPMSPQASAPCRIGAVCPLVVTDRDARVGDALSRVFGAGAVVTVSAQELAVSWPEHVVARARTGGALIAEREEIAEGLMSDEAELGPALARGALFGRPAEAMSVAGQLVFVLTDEAAPRRPISMRAETHLAA